MAIALAPRTPSAQVIGSKERTDLFFALAVALLFAPLAASTLILRLAVLFGFSFRVAAWGLAGVSALILIAGGLMFRAYWPDLKALYARTDKRALVILLLACATAGLVTSCLHRPDSDDSIYLPKVMHALAYPSDVMDGTVYELAYAPTPVLPDGAAPYYPTSYEFAQATFAYVSGVSYLYVYYALAPWLVGLFAALMIYLNFRRLELSTLTAATAVLWLIPLILLMGENHHALANVSLVRAFQPKYAFVLLGLEAFIFLSLRFFNTGDMVSWWILLIALIGICGMTTSALVMLPMLGALLFLSWWLAYGQKRFIRNGVAYGAALFPALLFALDYRRYAIKIFSADSILNAGLPDNFSGQLHYFTDGPQLPMTVIAFAVATLVCAIQWRSNLLLLYWTALGAVFYLNPWVAPWIVHHVTSANIYWRLFYILPFPLMAGVALGQCINLAHGAPLAMRYLPWLGFALLGAAVFVSPTSVMRPDNLTHAGLPGLTVDSYASEARECIALIPPGVVLAPIPLGQDMAIFSVRHEQIISRPDFLVTTLFRDPPTYTRRISAAQFIAGAGGRAEDLSAVLAQDKPSSVILAREAPSYTQAADLLAAAGLQEIGQVGDWSIFSRSPTLRAPE